MHAAARGGNVHTLKLLNNNGIPFNVIDDDDSHEMPYDYASETSSSEAMLHLARYGPKRSPYDMTDSEDSVDGSIMKVHMSPSLGRSPVYFVPVIPAQTSLAPL